MPKPAFLRSIVELATSEDVSTLLDKALAILEHELGVRGAIELWDVEMTRFIRGDLLPEDAAHRAWIGVDYTIGAIHLHAHPSEPDDVELLARQLAPIAEHLIERHASQHQTIPEAIAHLYERRIRDALVRSNWNASAVARELRVGRGRVGRVAQRWRRR